MGRSIKRKWFGDDENTNLLVSISDGNGGIVQEHIKLQKRRGTFRLVNGRTVTLVNRDNNLAMNEGFIKALDANGNTTFVSHISQNHIHVFDGDGFGRVMWSADPDATDGSSLLISGDDELIENMNPLAAWLPEEGYIFQEVGVVASNNSDPLKLVLDYFKSKGRGSEETINGDFSAGGAEWISAGETEFSVGYADLISTTGVYATIGQRFMLEVDTMYELTYRVGPSSVGLARLESAAGHPLIPTTSGTHKVTFKASATTLSIKNNLACNIRFEMISVRKVLGFHLTQDNENFRPTLNIDLGDFGPELIANNNFEESMDGWDVVLKGTAEQFSTYDGSVKLVNDPAQSGNVRIGYSIGVIPEGTTIKVSCDYIRGINGLAYLRLSSDPAGLSSNIGVQSTAGTEQSGTLEVEYTTDADREIFVVLVGGNADPSVTYFTGVSAKVIQRNGARSFKFNGVDQYLDATGLVADAGPKTVIAGVVTEDGETNNRQYLLDVATGRQISVVVGPVAGTAVMYDGAWTTGGGYNSEASSVLTFRHYANNGGIRANGAEILTENVMENPIGGTIAVGSHAPGDASFLNGKIYALLVFDRELSSEEIALCENWVASKQRNII